MGQIYFDGNKRSWMDKCGCSGGDKVVKVPANSEALEFRVSTNTTAGGTVTRKSYFIRPNMVAIDIDTRDAADFVAKGIAVRIPPSDYVGKLGYKATLGGY
jgi:hypothetical protein